MMTEIFFLTEENVKKEKDDKELNGTTMRTTLMNYSSSFVISNKSYSLKLSKGVTDKSS